MKQYKSFLVGVLVTVLASTLFWAGTVYAATGCFPDTNGHWAETFICWLKDNGITSGYPDGTYGPGNNVSRAEMSVFLQKTYDLANSSAQTKANTAETNAKAYADTLQTGDIYISANPSAWVTNGSGTNHLVTYYTNTVDLRSSATGVYGYQADVSAPVALYGRAAMLKGVRLCYTANANAILTSVYLRAYHASNGSGSNYKEVADLTDRTDATCRTYDIATPISMSVGDYAILFVQGNILNTSSSVQVSSTTFIFGPTTSAPKLGGEEPPLFEFPMEGEAP